MDLSEVQLKAVNHIWNSFSMNINPVCALDMGMGKTRVVCKIIQVRIDNSTSSRILIVHKASNHKDPWLKELKENKIISLENNKKENRYIYIHGKTREGYLFNNKYLFPQKVKILLTSYDTLRIDIDNEYYNSSEKFDLIVFDELHTIINSKKPTLASRQLITLQAKHKIAITGTPIQNSPDELGLIFIFLNDMPHYNNLINLDNGIEYIKDKEISGINSIDKKNILKEKQKVLKYGIDECIEKNGIFYHFEQKGDFIKKSVIFSLPIDDKMYSFINMELKNHNKKKLMFMSHPASIYFSFNRNQEFPCCTKAVAIKMILKSMLADEKAVIFSQYIDVLNVYFDFCTNLGLPAVIITGADKGKKLNEKLQYFEHAIQCRVLLTTLQKTSEGFDFYFATHIIILELWWNPQKIFQAMSRIDRKKQKRNIFIYLLCYNKNGEMLTEEAMFYNKITRKVNDTQVIYKLIAKKNKLIDGDNETKTRALPEIKSYFNMKTLQNDLNLFLANFHQTTELSKEQLKEIFVNPISETRQTIRNQILMYNECLFNLLYYPWHFSNPEISSCMYSFLMERLNGKTRKKLERDMSRIDIPLSQPNFPKHYPFVFIKNHEFIINEVAYNFYFVIGKKINGKYDLLFIQYMENIQFDQLFGYLKNIGIKKIDTVIIYDNSIMYNGIHHICDKLLVYFPQSECQLCITCFFDFLTREGLIPSQINDLNQIFLSESENDTISLCKNFANLWTGKGNFVAKKALASLNFISHIYQHSIKERSIIGSTNIISYIGMIVQIIIQNRQYTNFEDEKSEIENISRVVLENCPKIIPFWDQLTIPI